MVVLVVIVVLAVLCFLALRKDSQKRGETLSGGSSVLEIAKPKIFRYCVKCYKPCRPKDMVCRECGHVLRPDLLARYEATEKKIRYCSNCYKPCEPDTVVCEECGYILRPELFKPDNNE